MTRRWIPAALLVTILCLPSCSSSSKQVACTQIGCKSGADIGLDAFTRTGRVVTQAKVCINDKCETQRGTRANPLAFASVTTAIARVETVKISIELRGADGRVLASDQTQTRLQRNQPNGPKCAPICFVAAVHLTPAGKLAAGNA